MILAEWYPADLYIIFYKLWDSCAVPFHQQNKIRGMGSDVLQAALLTISVLVNLNSNKSSNPFLNKDQSFR